MAIETDADLAVFFNDAEFGLAATYTPPAGAAVSCTVLMFDENAREPSQFAGRAPTRGKLIQVRASEVAAPVRGGRFTIDGVVYDIVGSPSRELPGAAIWSCMTGG